MKVKELLVPLAIVAMIIGMVLPLPTPLLDILLIINLLVATALLLSALTVNDPIKLSALPTILLLATLFRLTLNISTTRLILSGGDAGQVVASFGSVVIGGSVVVGLVIFLIITLIQFIVIAKGAERIAEVAARFTLDAMPGKQMSVDADVRSGIMDVERARDKREELQVESRFYGALDGAMKFVKGDAIAGLIIVCVNIIGGVAVGLITEHLSIAHAFQKYVTLTIGDGLVSQIPALLNSLTAGIIVTKVARTEESSAVNELISQIAQGRMVKGIVCFVSLLLGCLPGMPTIPFVLIGIALFFIRAEPVKEEIQKTPLPVFLPKIPALISISGNESYLDLLRSAKDFTIALDGFRQQVFEEFGIILPRIEYTVEREEEASLRILFRGGLFALLSAAGEASLIQGTILSELRQIIDNYRPEIIDDIHTRRLLDFLESYAPELVSAVIPSVVSVTQLTLITRALTREGISLKHIDLVMQAVAESGARAQSDRQLLEEVRVALGRVIVTPFLKNGLTLTVITIDPLVDIAYCEAERGVKMVDGSVIEKLIAYLDSIKEQIPILVSKGSRALITDCLRMRGKRQVVLAFEEVPQNIYVEALYSFRLEVEEAERALDGNFSGVAYD
jgi:flagellar biosynthesis component FlhA